ncbi:MAG: PIG-L deacetylase family protein [Planctomycetota bacterium]|jgi:LmbE family N-acetylglucosaminyl deacetylase
MSENRRVLSLQAHPDDAEFMCAGVLSLLRGKGWDIHIATMTAGDCGSAELGREEISKIRRGEAANSVKLLNGNYQCLECSDVFIMYDKTTLLRTIEVLRKVQPTILFAPSPEDYFADHEITSRLVQTACFACGVANVETGSIAEFEPVPYLYYVDPVEGKDRYGHKIEPSIFVDISSVIDTKEQMLCCHQSQRSWLKAHHGIDAYVESMKEFARERGAKIGCEYAEGFRQHLGHSFPQENILKEELGDLVY